MSLEYLIDGYNFLLRRRPLPRRRGPRRLEIARKDLLLFLATHAPDPSQIRIVFDAAIPGGEAPGPQRLRYRQMTVEFATGYANADALIREIVMHHPSPQRLVVVSDDREVQRTARRCRATPMACADFESQLLDVRRRQHSRESPPETSRAPPAEEELKNAPLSAAEKEFWSRAFALESAPDQSLVPAPKPAPKLASPRQDAESAKSAESQISAESLADLLDQMLKDFPSDDELDDP